MTTKTATAKPGTLHLLEELREVQEENARLQETIAGQEARIRILERDLRLSNEGLRVHQASMSAVRKSARAGGNAVARALEGCAKSIESWTARPAPPPRGNRTPTMRSPPGWRTCRRSTGGTRTRTKPRGREVRPMPYADPEKRRQAKRESARRARAMGSTSPCGPRTLSLPVRVETAEDLLRLLAMSIAEVRADGNAGALDRARCVGYLCGIALRAVETTNLEARLAALEEERDQGTGGGSSCLPPCCPWTDRNRPWLPW